MRRRIALQSTACEIYGEGCSVSRKLGRRGDTSPSDWRIVGVSAVSSRRFLKLRHIQTYMTIECKHNPNDPPSLSYLVASR